MKKAVVNVAAGNWYPRGQARLRKTLENVGYDGDYLFWTDDLPPGCPSHDEVPYAFKAHALEMARARGYELALWCDASTWFLRDPAPLFDRIARDGYYLYLNPYETTGEFAADKTIELFDVSREDAMRIPSAVATFFGLDLASEIGTEILDRFGVAARNGSFCVPWVNDPDGPQWRTGLRKGFGSKDPRVQGCRHDQTAFSLIAYQLGLELDGSIPPKWFSYPNVPHSENVIALAEDDGGRSMDEWERTGYLKR